MIEVIALIMVAEARRDSVTVLCL